MKLTKEKLKQIIREELIKEGWFDKFRGKSVPLDDDDEDLIATYIDLMQKAYNEKIATLSDKQLEIIHDKVKEVLWVIIDMEPEPEQLEPEQPEPEFPQRGHLRRVKQ